MSLVDNIARMQRVEGVELAPGERVALEPGGYHLMLMDLAAPLAVGQHVPITLVFEASDGTRSALEVSAVVKPLNFAPGMKHSGPMKH